MKRNKLRLVHKLKLTCSAFGAIASQVGGAAYADPPTTKRIVGTLVTPDDAWTYYGSDTIHTNGVASSTTRAPEIRALARALSRDGELTGDAFAQRVAEYVKRNIETEFRFGLGKGARGAAIDQSGTVFDQANLMVEVLRERGQAANYRLGTITLNASQFGKWTGIVNNLNETTQSFAVNAKAACQLLADGGIPAIVNGASTCTGLSGNLSTVTLGHLWVIANGKAYDPGFKINILKSGIDIPAAMGCGTTATPTCGASLEAAAMAGATQGAAFGAPYIQNVNQVGVENFIHARALALQTAIEAIDPTAPLEDIIGGARVDVSQSAVGVSMLGYQTTVKANWSGDIPDKFRTKFRVQFMGMDTSLWADEIPAKRIRLRTMAPKSSWNRTTDLFIDGQSVASGTAVGSALQVDRPTLSVDHPMIGTYVDENTSIAFGLDPRNASFCVVTSATTNLCNMNYFKIVNLILDVGVAGQERSHKYSILMLDYKEDEIEPNIDGYINSGYNRNPGSPSTSADFQVQIGQAARIASSVSKSKITQFHIIGGLYHQDFGGDGQNYFNIRSALSSNNNNSDEEYSSSAFGTMAAVTAALEGSVQQQSADAYESSSSASMFKLANEKQFKFFEITSTNNSALFNSFLGYSTVRKAVLQSYVNQGYTVVAPDNGLIGSISLPGLNTGTVSLAIAPELIYNGSSVGYIINEEYKGGGQLSGGDPVKAVNESTKSSSKSVKDKSYYGLDLASGVINFRPNADISVGQGGGMLEFKRHFSTSMNGSQKCDFVYDGYYAFHYSCNPMDFSGSSLVGGGWNHNFNAMGGWSGNGLEGMGVTSAVRASKSIASLFAITDAGRMNSFARRMAIIFGTYSYSETFVRNMMTAATGSAQMQFVRLPNGRFDPPPAARNSKLDLTGAPSGPFIFPNGAVVSRLYDGTSFSLVDEDGRLTTFVPGAGAGPAMNAQGGGGTFLANNQPSYVPDTETAPAGIKTNYIYEISSDGNSGVSKKIISKVQNSYGNSISLNYSNFNAGQYETFTGGFGRVSTVTDRIGNSINYQCDESSPAIQPTVTVLSGVKFKFDCSGGMTNSVGGVTKYGMASGDGSSANSEYPDRILKSWFTPIDGSTPYLTINYDPTLKVASYTDIGGRTSKAFVSTIASDRYRIGELRDPSGAITSTVYDENGSAVKVSDSLGRVTTNVYDSARRILRTVYPEGNAVEYQYDLRGNKTRECTIAKGRVTWSSLTALTEKAPQCNTLLGDLATTKTYYEAATLRADQCINMKTCNKPAFEIDARGNRTDYTWSTDHGQLLSETKPADANGVRPVNTYGYSAFTGVDGATFYLLTSKVEKIDATNTTTTTYEYDTANKFVLKSSVVDSGGLALRTCYKFDGAGNLISKTDPKAGLAVCQ